MHQEVAMSDWTDRAPAMVFDLHGQTVLEAVENAERFLVAQRRARPGAVVRLITGRGRGGGGAPVRTRVRSLLRRLTEAGVVVRNFELEASEGSFLVRLSG
jgi:DNA-nicking Smr family endonuclease